MGPVLQHSCDVARNQALGTNGRHQFVSVATAVPSLFLPMSAQSAIQNQFTVGYAWDIYFNDGTDIQIGDRLAYNGQTYLVRGKQPFAELPFVSHLHVTAETEHGNGQ